MSEVKPEEDARRKYQKKVEDLANATGKRLSVIRKMLNRKAADQMFETDEKLQDWERKNFPDANNVDPLDK